MLSSIRSTTRVLGLGAVLILAAACSSGGGASSAPPAATVAPPTAAPSTGAASEAPSTAPTTAPSTAPSEAAGTAYQLTIVKDAKLGDILVGEDGMTVYTFSPDTAPNKSVCNGDCAGNWPPFIIETGESISAGTGVGGTVATFARDDGSMQVSYNGKPVYFFAGDKKAGDTAGQGVGEKWFVVKP